MVIIWCNWMTSLSPFWPEIIATHLGIVFVPFRTRNGFCLKSQLLRQVRMSLSWTVEGGWTWTGWSWSSRVVSVIVEATPYQLLYTAFIARGCQADTTQNENRKRTSRRAPPACCGLYSDMDNSISWPADFSASEQHEPAEHCLGLSLFSLDPAGD